MTRAPAAGSLAEFQDDFARALFAPDASVGAEVAALAAQPAFAVYRNTVMKGCLDALKANYPAVARLTGGEWFRAAAAVYVRESPPAEPSLLRYGASFAAFLERFDPARELPYLPGVARLDRFWSEAHSAADDPLLDGASLAGRTPDALAGAVLHTHAATRWAWFDQAPVYSIWARNRESVANGIAPAQPHWQAEGALLTRPHGAVQWRALNAAGCALLSACAAGRPLAAAADAALAADADADMAVLLASLLAAGAFSGISVSSSMIS